MSNSKILIPLLRKHVPTMLAQDILGIQPANYTLLSVVRINDVKWYRVRVPTSEVIEWIRSQDNELWNHEDFGIYEQGKLIRELGGIKFIIHEKLYTIFALRWS